MYPLRITSYYMNLCYGVFLNCVYLGVSSIITREFSQEYQS